MFKEYITLISEMIVDQLVYKSSGKFSKHLRLKDFIYDSSGKLSYKFSTNEKHKINQLKIGINDDGLYDIEFSYFKDLKYNPVEKIRNVNVYELKSIIEKELSIYFSL